jgi:hypothetical protein
MLIKPEPQVLATAPPPRTSSLNEEGAGGGGGACAAQKRGRDVTTPHDEEEEVEEGARPAALNLSTAAAHQSLSSLYAQQERKMTLKQVGVFATLFPLVFIFCKMVIFPRQPIEFKDAYFSRFLFTGSCHFFDAYLGIVNNFFLQNG